MTQKKLAIIILAAGKGKRMNSDLPKVLLKVKEKTMLEYNLDLAESISPQKIITVVGYKKELIIDLLKDKYPDVQVAVQEELLGTGHAVLTTRSELDNFDGNILILYGDVPLLKTETIFDFINNHNTHKNAVTVLTSKVENPFGYGRIIRKKEKFLKIVEEKDATETEKEIKEINSGIMVFDSKYLFRSLRQIKNNNTQKEYYLTDAIDILNKNGENVGAFIVSNSDEVLGANTPEQLMEIEKLF